MPVGAGSIKRAAKSVDANQLEKGQIGLEDKAGKTAGEAADGTDVQSGGKEIQGQKKKAAGTKSRQTAAEAGKGKSAREKAAEAGSKQSGTSQNGARTEKGSAGGEKTYGVGDPLPVHLL